LGTFWNFFGVACVNLNNLVICFLQKFTKNLDKSKHGVGGRYHSLEISLQASALDKVKPENLQGFLN
jgi:putative lipoic acid-binding regulatory protein